MPSSLDPSRDLLFGLLALQTGLINQAQLVAAFHAWTQARDRPMAEILAEHGALSAPCLTLVEGLVIEHLRRHGSDPEQSLAAIGVGRSTRECLARIGDGELNASLAHVRSGSTEPDADPDRTASYSLGTATSDGQRFRILRPHARGGLGAVFVALDGELHREVALKQILEKHADDPVSRQRFVAEAEITGGLEHPGVVPVYGLGTDASGRPYYAMRFIKGDSLKEAIERFHEDEALGADPGRRSLELRKLLRRFTDVCNAVDYAHSRGVIHRDIKPANIIVGKYGETLVVDWGLAKPLGHTESGREGGEHTLVPSSASGSAQTLPGSALGTPAYMSPEQAAGDLGRLGPCSDVYSLGATLFCLLTGRPPFKGADVGAVLGAVQWGDFPAPRTVDPSIDRALEAVCVKAMAPKPEERYATSKALAEDVERWLADQPVLAYPEPLRTRAIRWVRRHKPWVAAAAALLILTLLGLAIHDWQITREERRTTDQLGMTRNVLRELLKVSGENLALVPNAEKLREYLAQLVLDRYQRLGEKFPTDPGVRLETAQVFRVIGGIGRITGQFAKSQASYEKAIEVLAGLCEDDPDQADYRRWLVEAFIDRGELNHMNGRTVDAEKDFRTAIGHADKLLSLPNSASYQRTKASALINLSEILVLKGQHAEGRNAADQAVGLLKSLAGATTRTDLNRDRWLLCLALADRGAASKEAGDHDAAHQDFDEAEEVAGQVPREDEVYDDAQFQLACVSNQRGELLGKDPSRLPESVKSYQRASQILERLIKDHTLIPHHREEMAVTFSGRAAIRLAMGLIPDAQRDCKAALDHLAGLIEEQARKGAPENPQYLSLLGRTLAIQGRIHLRQGRVAEGRKALAEAEEKLDRAIQVDPGRGMDRAILHQIKTESPQATP
jgi:serine/threonine-protein kinase